MAKVKQRRVRQGAAKRAARSTAPGSRSARQPARKKTAATRSQSEPVKQDASEALVGELELRGIRRAKIGGFDVDGVLRGKYVSLEKLHSALEKGFGFCDVIFGWDANDQLYDNATITGWHTGYPDTHAVLDAGTLRDIPWEPGVVAMLCDFRDDSGRPHAACPRSLLKRVAAHAAELGFETKFGAEFEFFLFQETRDSLYEKNFKQLKPLDPGMFGYSWLREGQDAALMRDLWDKLEQFDVKLEGLHTETGPGVYEAALSADEVVSAADKAALFKTAVKEIAHQHGLRVTFMAKWNEDLPGASGHIHQSLWREGQNAFFAKGKDSISDTLRHYLGGQLALMRELTCMMSPTINSYKRYVPGLWAPLVPSWGIENRTCALRVITGGQSATRVEHRQPAADMNPYIAMACALGAGLYGIERRIEPPAPTQGDPGLAGSERLPTSLAEAAGLFAKSRAAKSLFGAGFADHYLKTRRFEVRAYETAVTDWELRRYFEVI